MNVPDPRIFTPVSPGSAPVRQADRFNLVYHGTMAERLGVDLIIQAVARLRDRIPTLRLHLWGHGDDLAQFQELARTLGIGKPEIPDWLATRFMDGTVQIGELAVGDTALTRLRFRVRGSGARVDLADMEARLENGSAQVLQ